MHNSMMIVRRTDEVLGPEVDYIITKTNLKSIL